MQLQATVETMNEKVFSLENQVESLETQVKDLTPLKKEVEQLKDVKAEKMQQYSRRNCIVLEGIPVKPRESISDLEKVVKPKPRKRTSQLNLIKPIELEGSQKIDNNVSLFVSRVMVSVKRFTNGEKNPSAFMSNHR